MQILLKPEAFSILTLNSDSLDWHDRFIYADKLRQYGYFVEALELEERIDESCFYEILELFLTQFKPNIFH